MPQLKGTATKTDMNNTVVEKHAGGSDSYPWSEKERKYSGFCIIGLWVDSSEYLENIK